MTESLVISLINGWIYNMSKDSSNLSYLQRKLLVNVCSGGHEQPVHHVYCSICGKPTHRKYSEHSWREIQFNATEEMTCICKTNKSFCARAFLSSFDNNLLIVFEDRQCILVREIPFYEGDEPEVKDFSINSLSGTVDNMHTDNRHIYIHCDNQLYLLDWVELLNSRPNIKNIYGTGEKTGIAHHKSLYIFSKSNLLKLGGSEANTIANLSEIGNIYAVETHENHLFIVGRKESGALFLLANDFNSPDSISQEVIIPYDGDTLDIVSALGQNYYAFSPNKQKLYVGKLSALQTNQKPQYCWEVTEGISKLFFIRHYLYVATGDSVCRWDMLNYTMAPDSRNSSVNLSYLEPSINQDSSSICIPIRQGNNDYISIMNEFLIQQSLSPGFPDPLIAYATYNNHVFAVTRNSTCSKIYIG